MEGIRWLVEAIKTAVIVAPPPPPLPHSILFYVVRNLRYC